MIRAKRLPHFSFSPVLVLSILALLVGVYFFARPLNDALQPMAFLLMGFLVMILVVCEITEHQRTAEAAHTARSLNEELDQRVAQRANELENANRKLETEIAEHQNSCAGYFGHPTTNQGAL